MKKNQHIIPIVIVALGIPTLLVGIFLVVANIFFHDEAPPDDAVLRLPDVLLEDTENAYFDVMKIDADLHAADPGATQPYADPAVDNMLNGETWDEQYVMALAKKYALAIADFRMAASKERYQGPQGAHPNAIDLYDFSEGIGSVRFAAQLIALDGIDKARNGDVAGGLSETMSIIRLAHAMESSQATLIEWLVSSATKHIGLAALRHIGLQTTVPTDQVKTVARELETYRDSRESLTVALKMEYAYSKMYLSKHYDLGQVYDTYSFTVDANGTVQPRSWVGKTLSVLDTAGMTRFYYQPHQSWRFWIDEQLKNIEYAQADCATGNLFPPRTPLHSQKTGFGRFFEQNTIGKLIADNGNVAFGGVVEKVCNESVAISATQTVLVINAYYHDTGTLPSALDELIPTYLEAIPLDPYSNQSLHYDANAKIIYSVGPKRVDMNGSPVSADWQNLDNPSFVVLQ